MPSAENHRNPTAQIGLLIQAMMRGHERTAVDTPTRKRRLTYRSQPPSGITVAGTLRRNGPDRKAPPVPRMARVAEGRRSEEHTSELQSLMRISYAVFCLKKKNQSEPVQHE